MVRLHSLVASHQRSRFMPRLGRHWRLALGFRACSPCPTVLLVPHLHSRLCSTVLLVPHICPSVPHSRICPSVRFRSFPLICPSVRFVSRCTHTPSRISQTVHFPSRLLDDYGALFEKFGVVLLKLARLPCFLAAATSTAAAYVAYFISCFMPASYSFEVLEECCFIQNN